MGFHARLALTIAPVAIVYFPVVATVAWRLKEESGFPISGVFSYDTEQLDSALLFVSDHFLLVMMPEPFIIPIAEPF